jgi:hypothetical protein
MKKLFPVMFLAVAVLFLFACASEKEPAQLAIKAAEEALNAVKGEAAKYVPDQLKSVEAALKTAKDNFEKKEYKAALESAKDLAAKAKELATAAATKKTELTKNWEQMSAGLPKMVDAIKSRVDILSKSKKLPANLDKAKFDGAKAGLAEITKTWTDAQDSFKAGSLAEALGKANTVKQKAAEIMNTLGMQVPAAAKT